MCPVNCLSWLQLRRITFWVINRQDSSQFFCLLSVDNKVKYNNEAESLFSPVVRKGDPAWSKSSPGTFQVFHVFVWRLFTWGKVLFEWFVHLRHQLGFYYMVIITLSSFELPPWRRSKYQTYQSLKRRSEFSCVRWAVARGWRGGWGFKTSSSGLHLRGDT